jgi:hypothetical protein
VTKAAFAFYSFLSQLKQTAIDVFLLSAAGADLQSAPYKFWIYNPTYNNLIQYNHSFLQSNI